MEMHAARVAARAPAWQNPQVVAVAAGKRQLVELEDKILRLLSKAEGSLLDNEELVLTLQSSKTTSLEVTQQLVVSEQTEKKIDAAREGYRPSAYRASILYFLIADLARVDPMYQFSLDAYVQLFNISLEKSAKSDDLQERIKSLNEYHTYFVYRSTCRALFEAHKLLFAFQICAKILQGAKKMVMAEYDFFLRGGQVFDKSAQPPNPCSDWIGETASPPSSPTRASGASGTATPSRRRPPRGCPASGRTGAPSSSASSSCAVCAPTASSSPPPTSSSTTSDRSTRSRLCST
jgi:hypothetical protein